MSGWLIVLLTTMLTLLPNASHPIANRPPETCPVTRAPDPPFLASPPNTASAPWEGYFWVGSATLWTTLPESGIWSGLPLNPTGYTQKILFWRQGYSWTDEPIPALTVTGQRLDAAAPPLNVSRPTNAFADDIQSAMLVGVDFPTLGCWQITGRYAASELSFVVWVAP